MSLSEIFDHGVPIPWANFRFNNVSIDGTNSSAVPAPATGGGPVGNIVRLSAKGTIRLTGTAAVNVYTFTLPVTAANPNGAFNVKFVTLFKGGPVGNTNNGLYNESFYCAVDTASVENSSGPFGGAFTTIGTFTTVTVHQTNTFIPNGITLGVQNSNAGHTTDVLWYAQVDYFIDNL